MRLVWLALAMVAGVFVAVASLCEMIDLILNH
jgi:hypothetical protein